MYPDFVLYFAKSDLSKDFVCSKRYFEFSDVLIVEQFDESMSKN